MPISNTTIVVINTARLDKTEIKKRWMGVFSVKPSKIVNPMGLSEALRNLTILDIAKDIEITCPSFLIQVLEMFNATIGQFKTIIKQNWDSLIQSLILGLNENGQFVEAKIFPALRKNIKLPEEHVELGNSLTFRRGLWMYALEKLHKSVFYYAQRNAYTWLRSNLQSGDHTALIVDSNMTLTGKLDTILTITENYLLTDGEFGPWDLVQLAYEIKPGESLNDYDDVFVQGCSKLSQVYATLVSKDSVPNIVEILDTFHTNSDCLLTCSPKLLTRFISKDNAYES